MHSCCQDKSPYADISAGRKHNVEPSSEAGLDLTNIDACTTPSEPRLKLGVDFTRGCAKACCADKRVVNLVCFRYGVAAGNTSSEYLASVPTPT